MQSFRRTWKYWSIGASDETPSAGCSDVDVSAVPPSPNWEPFISRVSPPTEPLFGSRDSTFNNQGGSYKATPFFLALLATRPFPPCPSCHCHIPRLLYPPLVLPPSPIYRTQRIIPLMFDGTLSIVSKKSRQEVVGTRWECFSWDQDGFVPPLCV